MYPHTDIVPITIFLYCIIILL